MENVKKHKITFSMYKKDTQLKRKCTCEYPTENTFLETCIDIQE